MINYNSIKSVIEYIKREELYLTKSRGQNFLVDPNIRSFIANKYDINSSDCIWEIGGGFGSLTSLLSQKTDKLLVFELDGGFARFLKKEFPDINLIEGDFLKTYKTLKGEDRFPKVIFGNLPYNISSKIITELAISDIDFQNMLFMVQKEMQERMTAKPGEKNYSSFSVFCQTFLETFLLKEISKEAFFPKPNITSAIINIRRNIKNEIDKNEIIPYEKLLRTSFSSRRKTLVNNLKNNFDIYKIKEILEDLKLKEDIRAERLSPNDFIKFFKKIKSYNSL